MTDEWKNIPQQKLIDLIIAHQKAIKINVSPEQITFSEKNYSTVYYLINGKSQGRIHLHSQGLRPDEAGYELEIQISSHDEAGNFELFKNINKSFYWYLDGAFNLKFQHVVIQESKNVRQPYESCLQLVGHLDKDDNIQKISYMYYGFDKDKELVIVKTGDKLSSLVEEDIYARYRYHQFKQPETFCQLFDDICGPVMNPLTLKEIENRLTVLEAIKY